MDEIVRLFLERLAGQLDPVVATFLERLLRFFQERIEILTRVYDEQTRNVGREVQRVIHDESSRLVAEGFKSLGRGLWQLAAAHWVVSILVALATAGGLFFYGRWRWRRFRWEPNMLAEAQRQNDLTAELRDATRTQNELLRQMVTRQNGAPNRSSAKTDPPSGGSDTAKPE